MSTWLAASSSYTTLQRASSPLAATPFQLLRPPRSSLQIPPGCSFALFPGAARGDEVTFQSSAQSGNKGLTGLWTQISSSTPEYAKSSGNQMKSWAPQSFTFPTLLHQQEGPLGFLPPPGLPQTLVWKMRDHYLQWEHMLMFLCRKKKECCFSFFPSGELVDPFLLGTACKSWRNHFSSSKTASETDLGKELNTFEITRCTVKPVPRRSRRKVDLVTREH